MPTQSTSYDVKEKDQGKAELSGVSFKKENTGDTPDVREITGQKKKKGKEASKR